MRQLVTKAIVLSRTNFGEADRILTVITPDFGKLSLMARGVRKSKSKLAGGVELLSVSDITFVRGRGDIATLISARLEKHHGQIVKDAERLSYAYEILKLINKNTEDDVESDYFDLLATSLAALDDSSLPLAVAGIYFEANLLKLAGHSPNLTTDTAGEQLKANKKYSFDTESASFSVSSSGQYAAEAIKFLRLVFSGNSVKALSRITNAERLATLSKPLVSAMIRNYLRVSP